MKRMPRLIVVALMASSAATLAALIQLPNASAGGQLCFGRDVTHPGTPSADRIEGTGGADVIWTGDGNDVVLGRGGNDLICADSGDDTVLGGTGADKVAGGDGRDLIDGGNGADDLRGGGGSDTAAFASSLRGVVVDLEGGTAGPSDPEEPRPADSIVGFERAIGSQFNDLLLGTSDDNALDGRRGEDGAFGNGGTDVCVKIESPLGCEGFPVPDSPPSPDTAPPPPGRAGTAARPPARGTVVGQYTGATIDCPRYQANYFVKPGTNLPSVKAVNTTTGVDSVYVWDNFRLWGYNSVLANLGARPEAVWTFKGEAWARIIATDQAFTRQWKIYPTFRDAGAVEQFGFESVGGGDGLYIVHTLYWQQSDGTYHNSPSFFAQGSCS